MQVIQRAFTQRKGDSSVVEKRKIRLTGESGEIQEIRSAHNVSGKYDLYQFSFKTKLTPGTVNSSLYLEVLRLEPMSTVDIPILIKASKGQVAISIVSIVGLIVGIGLILFVNQISSLSTSNQDWLKSLGFIMAIISSYLRPYTKSIWDIVSAEVSV